jgi:hypothetical protein
MNFGRNWPEPPRRPKPLRVSWIKKSVAVQPIQMRSSRLTSRVDRPRNRVRFLKTTFSFVPMQRAFTVHRRLYNSGAPCRRAVAGRSRSCRRLIGVAVGSSDYRQYPGQV